MDLEIAVLPREPTRAFSCPRLSSKRQANSDEYNKYRDGFRRGETIADEIGRGRRYSPALGHPQDTMPQVPSGSVGG